MRAGQRSNYLFPELPPRENVPPYPAELGEIGGPMDGGYGHLSNIMIPAGYTYFAQFVAHDLTCSNPPRLNLRSVYGDGPWREPRLYDDLGRGLLRTGRSLRAGALPDVPRDSLGRALIGDPRNDYTLILVQLHAAFIQLHNMTFSSRRCRDWLAAFLESQQLVRWQYQWLVVNDLLRRLIGDALVDQIIDEGSYLVGSKCLPLEFTLAVGRFGHAMVQPRYRINSELDVVVFRDHGGLQPFDDLRGQPLDRQAVIEWDNFFPIGNPVKVQASGKLNSKICRPLFQFPFPNVHNQLEHSIPYRTLVSGQRAGLPSGQAVARAMGFDPVPEDVLWSNLPYRGVPAPLWFYVLREAEFQQHGQRLGQVGAKILAAVILGALMSDRSSYFFQPNWCPRMGSHSAVSVGDLLRTVIEDSAET
jgi:hypothetical protein